MLFNKDELIQCMMEAGIIVNEDWLDYDEYVDSLLVDLASKVVNESTYLGCGIARAAFRFGDWVIKCSRGIVNYDRGHYEERYGSVYNRVNEAYDIDLSCDEGVGQTCDEINWYMRAMSKQDYRLAHVAEIYACSKNRGIELVEYCDALEDRDGGLCLEYNEDDMYFLDNNFNDVHTGNVGFNRKGQLVVIDLGFN